MIEAEFYDMRHLKWGPCSGDFENRYRGVGFYLVLEHYAKRWGNVLNCFEDVPATKDETTGDNFKNLADLAVHLDPMWEKGVPLTIKLWKDDEGRKLYKVFTL